VSDWSQQYPDAAEEIDPALPTPKGVALSTAVYFDSDHAHDKVTRRSVTGVISYVGSTPVDWFSKRQVSIETSSYSAEFCAGRTAAEEAISLRYMLRCLGVPLKGRTFLCGDNESMLVSCTTPESKLNKKHVAIAYHKLRECAAAGIINPVKVHTSVNRADILTKALPRGEHVQKSQQILI